MALAPAAASPPADLAAAPATGMAPETDAANPDEGKEPEVFATILKNPDGTWMLVAGDEPEPPEAGAEPAGEGTPPAEAAPEGKTFDTPQALLKGVMDMLEGSDTSEAEFDAGFKGGSEASPAKAPPPAA